jgi:pimeloyl-ACP methyl ester carboxylesterase
MEFISGRLGYRLGRDLFGLPYDFRQDLTGMAASGELRRLANKIEAAVAANCGKKAILIGHSMGGLVGLALLRHPGLEAWR